MHTVKRLIVAVAGLGAAGAPLVVPAGGTPAPAYRDTSAASPVSAGVTATPVAAAPGAPTHFLGRAGDASAFLSWNAVTGATSYRVYRDGTPLGPVSATNVDDTGLVNGTTYAYAVTAVVGGVETAATSTATITPVVLVLAPPDGVLATAGDTRVTLNWTPAANASSYRIYRDGTLVGTSYTAGYTDTGLTDGTGYTYTVVACAGPAMSGPSMPVAVTPHPSAGSGTYPGSVAAIVNGHGTVRVTIVVSGGAVVSIAGALLTHDSATSLAINTSAIPQYDTRALAARSASITKVTGATLTWTAYRNSLQSALTQAGW